MTPIGETLVGGRLRPTLWAWNTARLRYPALWQDLTFCVPFWSQADEIVRGDAALNVYDPFTVGRLGRALAVGGDAALPYGSRHVNNFTTLEDAPFTLFVALDYTEPSHALNPCGFLSNGFLFNQLGEWTFYLQKNRGIVFANRAPNKLDVAVYNLTPGGLAPGYHTLGIRRSMRGPGELSIMLDGDILITYPAGEVLLSPIWPIAVGATHMWTNANASLGNYYLAGIWNRALSDEDFRLLTRDPFAMFRRERRRSFTPSPVVLPSCDWFDGPGAQAWLAAEAGSAWASPSAGADWHDDDESGSGWHNGPASGGWFNPCCSGGA